MRHFCACIRGIGTIIIFIAAIEVMAEPRTLVATPIASAASLPNAPSIIMTIGFMNFIMVVSDVIAGRATRAAHRIGGARARGAFYAISRPACIALVFG